VEHETFDQGIANTADVLIILLTTLEEMPKILPFLSKSIGKKIFVFNKIDLLSPEERRKLEAQLKTRKLNFIMISAKTKENLLELIKKLWESFGKIRVYTKQPNNPPDPDPIIFPPETTIKKLAEKVFHGLSSNVLEAKVTGPSSKFPNQKVGLDHILKDKDIVEFKTR
ncbi:MAG: TGS domain-containing protein, partial [Nanoarchaeota archaeon]